MSLEGISFTPSIGGDILRGADDLATFIYGDANIYGDAKHRRKAYNLVETNRMPYFRLGAIICARRSILTAWIVEQERRSTAEDPRDSE